MSKRIFVQNGVDSRGHRYELYHDSELGDVKVYPLQPIEDDPWWSYFSQEAKGLEKLSGT